jgi:hypothetical protein
MWHKEHICETIFLEMYYRRTLGETKKKTPKLPSTKQVQDWPVLPNRGSLDEGIRTAQLHISKNEEKLGNKNGE